jgi:hypothetical protein
MIKVIDKIIAIKTEDNKTYLETFPLNPPLFVYEKASSDDIRRFESKFGITLPRYITQYFMYFNPIKVTVNFVNILGLNNIIENYVKLHGYEELLQDKYIPLADEDGDLICINSNEDTGNIYHFYHDTGELMESEITFETYLENLIS